MTKHTDHTWITPTIRDLDPAQATTLTADERERANASLDRILATPHEVQATSTIARRRNALIPAGLAATAAGAIALPTLLGGTAFASWTTTPAPLPSDTAAAAAATCRSALDIRDAGAQVIIGERRGGWSYVLTDGPAGEGACLMPDGLIGSSGPAAQKSGFFGSYEADAPDAPVPPRNGITETESTQGAVTLPGRLSVGTIEGWFSLVSGYAGADVVAITVHPPVGPDVDASLTNGRYAAWWPAGEARGDNPGVGGAWTYTVTLSDGTTRQVDAD